MTRPILPPSRLSRENGTEPASQPGGKPGAVAGRAPGKSVLAGRCRSPFRTRVVLAIISPPDAVRRGLASWSLRRSPEKETGGAHFNELLTEVNLSLRLLPKPLTTAIIASEIPAAIRPYSIAVAPD